MNSEGLKFALRLKEIDRTGWIQEGVKKSESVAAHSWGVSLLALLLMPDGINESRVLKMAILHDLAEVIVGDITPHDGISTEDKFDRELNALGAILSEHPMRDNLLQIWAECESKSSPEGRFVKECDKLDMALQALIYREKNAEFNHMQFIESALESIESDTLRDLLNP